MMVQFEQESSNLITLTKNKREKKEKKGKSSIDEIERQTDCTCLFLSFVYASLSIINWFLVEHKIGHGISFATFLKYRVYVPILSISVTVMMSWFL